MREELRDTQKHLPAGAPFVSPGDFLSSRGRPGFGYAFPPAPEALAAKVKQKMLEAVLGDAPPFYAPAVSARDARWSGIFDHLFARGYIKHVGLDEPFTDEPKLYFFDIWSPFDTAKTDGHKPQYGGYSRGVSEDYEEAISKVIGEFLERYSLLIYRTKDLVRASIRDLERSRKKFLNPFLLAGFSEEQKKRQKELNFNEDSVFHWAEGESLLDGKKALIPAQLIFWTYCRHHSGGVEPRLRESNTNGAGGYFTKTGAILSGLYEGVQRDAFLVHWLNHASPPVIANDTVRDPVVRRLMEEAARLRFEVKFLDVTSDVGVPAVFCALLDQSGAGPRLAFGGGCGPHPAQVLRRALTEAIGLYHWLRKKKHSVFLPKSYVPFSEPLVGQLERLLMWGNPAMYEHIAFLFAGRKEEFGEFAVKSARTDFASEAEELSWLVRRVARFGEGYEPFCYTAEHPLLAELGYASAKVVVPKLVPLYLNENLATVGAPRIKEAMVNMGLEPARALNPWPHPFP